MAFYGQVLDETYNPVHDSIYPIFTKYFNNPKMTKIKDVDKFSMYMAKIYALLDIEYKYLVVFVYKDNLPIGSEKFLGNLSWNCLQTRTLTDNHNLPYHSYVPKRLPEINQKITLQEKNQNQFIYKVENLPIKISLLPKNKNSEWQSSGTVPIALETYYTVVNLI